MKFDKNQFDTAEKIYHILTYGNECDSRIWGKDPKNEKVYRDLKAGVRAWSCAIPQYMDENGNVLVSEEDLLLAREYAEKGSSAEWNGELHKKYLSNGAYRASVNQGRKILEIENGLNSVTHAIEIYNKYKGQFLLKDNNYGSNYTEQVLSGEYEE